MKIVKIISIVIFLSMSYGVNASSKVPKEFYGGWSDDCKNASWDHAMDNVVMEIDKDGIRQHEVFTQIKNAKWLTKGKILEVITTNCDEEGCSDPSKETWALSNSNNLLSITDSVGVAKLTRSHKK